MHAQASDVVVIVAPAGYGKTRLATSMSTQYAQVGWCDCTVSTPRGLAAGIVNGLSSELGDAAFEVAQDRGASQGGADDAWRQSALRAWTSRSNAQSLFVFENVEDLADSDAAVGLLCELLMLRPAHRRLVFCSRIPLPRRLARLLSPDKTRWIPAADLRMSDADARALLRGADAPELLADAAVRLADGWPMAILVLCRFAAEGRLSEAISHDAAATRDSLCAYLASEFIRLLSSQEFETFLVAAILPAPTVQETIRLCGFEARTFADFVDRTPFLTIMGDEIAPHPIICALVAARHRASREDIFRRALELARNERDVLRCAEIALRWGNPRLAARFLADVEDIAPRQLGRVVTMLGEMDRDIILEQPALWVATLELRRFTRPRAELLSEARRVFASVARSSASQMLYFEIVRQYVSILMHCGALEEAKALIAKASQRVDAHAFQSRLELMMAAVASMQGRYVSAREMYAAWCVDHKPLAIKYLDLIDATTALRSGKYEEGKAILEEASRVNRQLCWVAPLLVSLSNLAYEAWLVDDDETFTRNVAELKASILPSLSNAWRFWLAAANGKEESPTGFEPFSVVAIGYFFLACAQTGAARVRSARRAVESAQASGDIGLRIIALIIESECDPERRRAALGELEQLAQAVELESFRDAVVAYVDGSKVLGSLERFILRRVRNARPDAVQISVDVLSGSILVGQEPLKASTVERALVHFLATYDRAASRQIICDALWPDAAVESGANNLKVVVHRLRKKLGTNAVMLVVNGYCLGPHVHVNLVENERRVRNAQSTNRPNRAEALDFVRMTASIENGSRHDLLRYDWYTVVDRRLEILRRNALFTAARAFLALSDAESAKRIALKLVQDDECDDEASELLVLCLRHLNDDIGVRSEHARIRRKQTWGGSIVSV